jgi:hypothetical protein
MKYIVFSNLQWVYTFIIKLKYTFMSHEQSPQSAPNNDKKSLGSRLRSKITPLVFAGVSSFSAGQALATEAPQLEGLTPLLNIEAVTDVPLPSEAVTFSQENYQTVNSFMPTMNNMIADFKYITEKDQAKLSEKVDASITEIQECITRANKMTDKKSAEFCSSKATEIKNLMAEYRASGFKNEAILNQAILVQNIFSSYVDRYNEAYQMYSSSQDAVQRK